VDVEKITKTLKKDPNEILSLGRVLGRELPKKRMPELRKFWALLGDIPESKLNFYARGYRAALLDVARSYEAEFYRDTNLKEQKEFVIKDGYRPILKDLLANSKTQKELAISLGLDYSLVGAKLKELRELSLVDGYPGLFQRLTILGEQIAKNL
jgi:hypothetical protein